MSQKQKDVALSENFGNLGQYRCVARKMLRDPNFTYSNLREVYLRFGVLNPVYFNKGE